MELLISTQKIFKQAVTNLQRFLNEFHSNLAASKKKKIEKKKKLRNVSAKMC